MILDLIILILIKSVKSGFKPQKTIEFGISEICDAFKNGLYQDSLKILIIIMLKNLNS